MDKKIMEMTVKELFEKYCGKYEDEEYNIHGHGFRLIPASERELLQFRKNFEHYGVDKSVIDELEKYYSQSRSLFDYFNCDDIAMFDWWDEGDIWFGCLDDESFIYDSNIHKYAIGEAGSHDIGEFDTFMEMLEFYLKEGYDNGWNTN